MHPFLNIFGHFVPLYGLMIAIGILISGNIAYQTAKRRGIDADGLTALVGYSIFGGFIGAKILYLATEYHELDLSRLLDPTYRLSLINSSGFVVMGGLATGALCGYIASKIHHLDVGKMLQNTIFALPLAQGFGRIGCFFAGCCYGVHYDGFLSVTFPEGSFPGSVPRLPIQLISALALFALSLGLYLISRTVYKKYLIAAYIGGYAFLRFIIEFFRGDEMRGIAAGISLSQYLSLGAVGVMLVYVGIKQWRIKRLQLRNL